MYSDKVSAVSPNDTRALNNRGTILYNFGRYDDSLFYFNKVLATNHDNAEAQNKKDDIIDKINKLKFKDQFPLGLGFLFSGAELKMHH